MDEIIKFIIYYFFSDKIDSCSGSNFLIHLHPTFNKSGSFLNLKLNSEFNYFVFFLLTIFGFLFSVFLFILFLQKKNFYNISGLSLITAVFFISGTLGRVIERFLWDFTLDFIAVKYIGILDLIDLYFLLGCIGIIIVSFIFQLYDNKKTQGMSKNEKRFYNKSQFKKFIQLFKFKKHKKDLEPLA